MIAKINISGEYPWTVAILRKLNRNVRQQTLLYSGAGSLIHPSVVLTAANKHHTGTMDLVRAGEWDFGATNEELPYQDRVISHVQNLNEADPDSVQLIFITEPFVLALNVRTICLPFPGTLTESIDKRECISAAWGQQNCSAKRGLHSIQGRTEMTIEPQRSMCESNWQQYLEDQAFKLKDNQFCTKRKLTFDDSCFCDHGAALFCPIESSGGEETRYEQTGVSIATGGCTKELSGIVYFPLNRFRSICIVVQRLQWTFFFLRISRYFHQYFTRTGVN